MKPFRFMMQKNCGFLLNEEVPSKNLLELPRICEKLMPNNAKFGSIYRAEKSSHIPKLCALLTACNPHLGLQSHMRIFLKSDRKLLPYAKKIRIKFLDFDYKMVA